MDFGNKNISNAIVVNGPYYIHYYLDKLDADVRFVQYKNDGSTDMLSLIKILDSVSTPYFSYAWTKPAPAEIDPAIREKYPCVLEQKNYSGLSGVTLYAKAIQDSCIQPPEPVFVFRENFNNLQYSPEPASSISASDSGTFKMDSLTEYAPGFTGRANQINQGDFNSVEIKVSAYSQGEIKNTILVLSLENDNGIYLWRGSQLQNFIVPGSWGKAFLSYTFTEQISENDVIRIYCWNPGKGEILIDDFEVRFY